MKRGLVRRVWFSMVSGLVIVAACSSPTGPGDGAINVAPGESLAGALEEAPEGSEIRLSSGVHEVEGTLVVTKDVTIIGQDGTIVRGDGSSSGAGLVTHASTDYGAPVLYVSGADITLRNMTIEYLGTAESDVVVLSDSTYALRQVTVRGAVHITEGQYRGNGLVIVDGSDGTLENVTVADNGWNGMVVSSASTTVTGLTATGNGDAGIVVFNGTAAIVEASAEGSVNGALLIGASTVTIDDSVFRSNGNVGIAVGDTSIVTVRSTELTDNGGSGAGVFGEAQAGFVAVTADGNGVAGLYAYGAALITITDSVLSNNLDSGLTVLDQATAVVSGTTVESNQVNGIYLRGSPSATISDTVVRSHGGVGLLVGDTASASVESSAFADNGNGGVFFGESTVDFLDVTFSGSVVTGADVFGTSTADFVNVTISGSGDVGLSIYEQADVTLSGSAIQGSGTHGIYIRGEATLQASTSTVTGNGHLDGIKPTITVQGTASVYAMDLDVSMNYENGFYVMDSGFAAITNSTIADNISRDGIVYTATSSGSATGNTISGHALCGILFAGETTATESGNTFADNVDGNVCDIR